MCGDVQAFTAVQSLDRTYPTAKWLVTYSEDALQWLDSVNAHYARMPCPPHGRLECRFYGCNMGLCPPSTCSGRQSSPTLPRSIRCIPVKDNTTRAGTHGSLSADELPALLRYYRTYYEGLFQYLRGRRYALVDVRAGRYDNLSFINDRLKGPFPAKNTRANPGQWVGCAK